MDPLNLGNTQTAGFPLGDEIDISKKTKTSQEFVFKFVDFVARMLDRSPDQRNWQTYILTLYDEATELLEKEQR